MAIRFVEQLLIGVELVFGQCPAEFLPYEALALARVLSEGVIGAAPGRGAAEVAPPRVGGEGVAIPLLDGVRRIGQAYVEVHEAVSVHELGLGEGASPDGLEILDATEKAFHPGDGGGREVAFLEGETDIPP